MRQSFKLWEITIVMLQLTYSRNGSYTILSCACSIVAFSWNALSVTAIIYSVKIVVIVNSCIIILFKLFDVVRSYLTVLPWLVIIIY